MAVRVPLKLAGSDLKEMSSAEIVEIKNRAMYLYGTNPSVYLSVVGGGGNLGNIADTRLKAGAGTTDVTNFDTAGETGNISTLTINHAKMNIDRANTSASPDTNSVAFPVFYSNDSVQAMTLTDIYDTFIYPAIDALTDGSDRPGTYRIHTTSSLSGHTLVSSTAVFTDTHTNIGAYSAAGIYETQDQFVNLTHYYLHQTNAGSAPTYQAPLSVSADGGSLSQYSVSAFDAILLNCIRHVASEVPGSKIQYSLSTGTAKGTLMVNKKYNGSGDYQQRYVNTDDYRTQEFPNGSLVIQSTSFLGIYQN